VQDAVDAARAAGWPVGDEDCSRLAVYGRMVGLSAPLHDGDRLELLRPLEVDPKQRRRARAAPGRG
jgi:putative ubiquitin-RnfH superfamily antitoxin RatB of RatAB toxin-antitoxin module